VTDVDPIKLIRFSKYFSPAVFPYGRTFLNTICQNVLSLMGLTSSNFMVFTLIFTVSLSQGCKNAVAHSRRAAKSLGVRELDLQRRSIARSFASGIPFVPQSYLISVLCFRLSEMTYFFSVLFTFCTSCIRMLHGKTYTYMCATKNVCALLKLPEHFASLH